MILMNQNSSSMNPVRTRVESGLIGALFLLLFYPVIFMLVEAWNSRPDASHGWFVVPIAGWIAWTKRKEFLAAPARSCGPALIIVFAGLLLAVMSERIRLESVARLAMLTTLNGLLLFTMGWPRYRVVMFPALFIFLMVPMPVTFTGAITFPLQLMASALAENAISLLGIPVSRMGNVLTLPAGKLEVAEACSGLRSLMTFVTIGVLLAWLTPGRVRRITVALLAIPFALFANILRLTFTGVGLQMIGPESTSGFIHELVGISAFLISMGLYAASARALGSRWTRI
jgi:exosortase